MLSIQRKKGISTRIGCLHDNQTGDTGHQLEYFLHTVVKYFKRILVEFEL